jgi:hypothetical protein
MSPSSGHLDDTSLRGRDRPCGARADPSWPGESSPPVAGTVTRPERARLAGAGEPDVLRAQERPHERRSNPRRQHREEPSVSDGRIDAAVRRATPVRPAVIIERECTLTTALDDSSRRSPHPRYRGGSGGSPGSCPGGSDAGRGRGGARSARQWGARVRLGGRRSNWCGSRLRGDEAGRSYPPRHAGRWLEAGVLQYRVISGEVPITGQGQGPAPPADRDAGVG